MTLYKDDWEKELEANKMALESHRKGFEILEKTVEFFEVMVKEAPERPKKEE